MNNNMNICSDPGCRSRGERRRVNCRGRCQACYMRLYRREKAESVTAHNRNEARDELRRYVERHSASERHRIVRALLDDGLNDVGIIQTFLERPDLAIYVAGSKNSLRALKRDIAAVHVEDSDKSPRQAQLERHVRLIQKELRGPHLRESTRSKLILSLREDERELISLAG